MSLNQLKEVVMKVNELVLNPHNVKKHPKKQLEQLVKSVQIEKVYRHPIIDTDKVVWAGNGLVMALMEAGMGEETLKCYELPEDYTTEQKNALMIRDNKLGVSDWEDKNLLEALLEADQGGLFTGFTKEEISKLATNKEGDELMPAFELTPILYEKYNFILVFFSDELDFLFAQQAAGLTIRQDRYKHEAIGLCRAIPWKEFYSRLTEKIKAELNQHQIDGVDPK
jgi:hypothetical protein